MGSRSIECLLASILPQFPGEELGQLRSRRCEGEKDSVVDILPLNPSCQGFVGPCCLDPHRCLRSPEPAAHSFSCADLSFYMLWLSVAKNQIVVEDLLVQNPRILCCLAHSLVSMSCVLHQLFSLCLAREFHHVHKRVWVGAALVIFAAVPRCSPQPSLSARISRCLEESCA